MNQPFIVRHDLLGVWVKGWGAVHPEGPRCGLIKRSISQETAVRGEGGCQIGLADSEGCPGVVGCLGIDK